MENSEAVVKLASYMQKSKKRQYELAAEIGVPPQTVHRWLRGKTQISRAYLTILRTQKLI